MTVSIRGAHLIDPASGLDKVCDLHIEAGRIIAIGDAPEASTPPRKSTPPA